MSELDRRFDYHAADEFRAERHRQIREACKAAAAIVDEELVNGREKSLALTNLEQAMFWANASIAREEP